MTRKEFIKQLGLIVLLPFLPKNKVESEIRLYGPECILVPPKGYNSIEEVVQSRCGNSVTFYQCTSHWEVKNESIEWHEAGEWTKST